MPNIRNILVPVDFSETSEAAFRVGLVLGRPERATIHLMHDVELPTETITGATIIREEMEEEYAESERKMRELEAGVEVNGASLQRAILKSTDPKRSILTYSKENDIDLIVLGTHGRTDPLEKILGSTAERVLRRSSWPTVTVRPVRAVDRIDRILVPVDFSEYAGQALQLARDLAAVHQARVTVFHAGRKDSLEEDEERLREITVGIDVEKDRLDHLVASGDVDESILQVAEDQEADLIVMITHGRKGVRRALTRSVAESIVRKAPCPVMTSRRE